MSPQRGVRQRTADQGAGPGRATSAVCLLGVAVLSSACGAPGSSDALHGPAAAGTAAAPAGELALDPVGPADPQAPPAYTPVVRGGQPARPTLTAGPGRFSSAAPVRFPDGVSLAVVHVARGVEQGRGPGVFTGRPHTTFSLALTNGSTRPIDLRQVVVTTTYGSPARLAPAVYEEPSARDFSDTVAVGATTTATYAFAIPRGQARSAITVVDFDDVHVAARFTGLEEG